MDRLLRLRVILMGQSVDGCLEGIASGLLVAVEFIGGGAGGEKNNL